MAQIIDMPKLSDTMTVGTLVKWLKKEGDAVRSGDMLAEVETDKATMELECFFDGTIVKIFAPDGSQVEIGAPLCAIGKPGETVNAPEKGRPAAAAQPAPAAAKPAAGAAAPAPATPVAAVADRGSQPAPHQPAPAPGGRIRISPLARKLAAEKGIDPATLTGSGPGGRIVRADVLAGNTSGRAAPAKGAGAAPAPAAGESQPVSNMRATIARRLVEAKSTIPHFYLEVEIDAAPLLEMRAQLNAGMEKDAAAGAAKGAGKDAPPAAKLSVNDFVLKAAAEALRRMPAVNSSWDHPAGGQPSIRRHGDVHVSLAVAIEDGLITPVIRNTDEKSLIAISAEAKSLAKRAKEKKLAPAEYTGGTFCVTNLGMMGVDRFSAIINPPNAAILAVGATVKKPVVKDDAIVVGQRMTLTLSCDHRVVDGATGATFLAAIRELLEKPVLLFL